MTAAAAIDHQSAKASPIVVFRERCEARAMLVANGLHDLRESVDTLQAAAETQGLIKQYGQDRIQEILAQSFRRWSV
jgi:hypothetical protein